MRSIVRLAPFLTSYTFCGDDVDANRKVNELLVKMIDASQVCPYSFQENLFFNDPKASNLKEEFKLKFRNITRIMDCVDCQKCRLWGKLQTIGLGTALKILFSFDQSSFK